MKENNLQNSSKGLADINMEDIVRGNTTSIEIPQATPTQSKAPSHKNTENAPQEEVSTESTNGSKHPKGENSWQHFSVICSIEIVNKIKALSAKEGFTIRSIIEKLLGDGLSVYEKKHGPLVPDERRIEDLF